MKEHLLVRVKSKPVFAVFDNYCETKGYNRSAIVTDLIEKWLKSKKVKVDDAFKKLEKKELEVS